MAVKRATLRTVSRFVQEREEFRLTSGNLRGRHRSEGTRGWLDDYLWQEFTETLGRITYIVYSFDTPIAWVLDDGSIREPDVWYSQRTTRHQSAIKGGL